MNFYYSPESLLSLQDYGIEIPLTDGRIQQILSLLAKKGISPEGNFDAMNLTRDDLLRVHSPAYVTNLFSDNARQEAVVMETFELKASDGSYHRYRPEAAKRKLSELVAKVLHQTKGTMLAVKSALSGEDSFHLGGGYHHAMSFGGRGFCMINDIVIAARWAQKHHGAKTIWVIDVDAHKGDGTAELTCNDLCIKTLSIHMRDSWPLDSVRYDEEGKLQPWFIENDIDLGIGAGEENLYLKKLEAGLNQLEKSSERPSLAIVVQGSDPYERDELPSTSFLKLSLAQMLERDLLVHGFLRDRKIPQAYVMAGGYGAFAHEPYCQFFEAVL